ncbi:hypothetical protein V6Z11_A12G307100 [Gossypium hirsutum]
MHACNEAGSSLQSNGWAKDGEGVAPTPCIWLCLTLDDGGKGLSIAGMHEMAALSPSLPPVLDQKELRFLLFNKKKKGY